MNTDTNTLRSRLRGLSTILKAFENERRALREEQVKQLIIAMEHRATVSEAAASSGLSRAYLHRIGIHLHRGSADSPPIREAALQRAAELRDRLGAIDKDTSTRNERDRLIRKLAQEMHPGAISKDADISGERVRLIVRSSEDRNLERLES